MINDLRAMTLFVRTVELGSFRAAAETLNLSPSVVSYHIAALEKKHGVALLYRSTRKLALTDEGRRFFERAKQMVIAAEEALNILNENTASPYGNITLSMPAALLRGEYTAKVAAFSKDHPNVHVSMRCTDEAVDLIASGVDLALRTGTLKDSSLKSKRIGAVRRKLVCSADYLSQKKPPESPMALADWDWVRLKMLPPIRDMIGPDGVQHSIHFKSHIEVDSVEAMYQFVRHGAGLASPPDFLVAEDIARGTMVEIFPEWRIPDMKIWTVWPPNVPKDSLTMRLIGYLASD
ncbi:MAG: LysR family transcriptional regulator [Sneathiella sp.]